MIVKHDDEKLEARAASGCLHPSAKNDKQLVDKHLLQACKEPGVLRREPWKRASFEMAARIPASAGDSQFGARDLPSDELLPACRGKALAQPLALGRRRQQYFVEKLRAGHDAQELSPQLSAQRLWDSKGLQGRFLA